MVYVPLPVNFCLKSTFEPIPQSFAALTIVVFVVAPFTQYSKLKVYSSPTSTSAEQYPLMSFSEPVYFAKSNNHTDFMFAIDSSPLDGSNVLISISETDNRLSFFKTPAKLSTVFSANRFVSLPVFISFISHT